MLPTNGLASTSRTAARFTGLGGAGAPGRIARMLFASVAGHGGGPGALGCLLGRGGATERARCGGVDVLSGGRHGAENEQEKK